MCLFNPVVDGGRFKKTVACHPAMAEWRRVYSHCGKFIPKGGDIQVTFPDIGVICNIAKYSLQGTTQGRYLTGGVPPVRFSM